MNALPAFQYAWPVLSGLAAGLVYFLLLAQTTRLHLEGAPFTRLLPLFALRMAIAVALFWLIAQHGPLPLLLALAGFLLARFAVQFRVARP